MTLSPQFLDELRTRTTLSALVGKSVKLQRSGNEHKACCPFHTEKTPSFWVNDDKGFYHCFGCGAHGDSIRWMTDQRGLPFIDAVKELAAAAGMEMPAPDRQSQQRAERAKGLHDLMADAQTWFADRLGDEGAVARDALTKRGIKAETARAFGMGYAPDSRGKLKAALASYGDAMLVESGMLISVEGKEPYDRFRGRLMIPIRDARGRTIAFGGRILGDGEPKYLNSPETPLFDKGRTLYNIDRAQAAARKAKRVIAVEGYMDVIALAQAGYDEVVAPLGTALTEHQLERLWRMADCPILCFDGDAAGIKAARRAAERALPLLTPGKSIAIVTIPNGMDPDDLVRDQGAQAFEELLSVREPLADFLCRDAFDRMGDIFTGPDERAACQAGLHRLIETIREPIIRREYHRTITDRCWRFFRRARPAPMMHSSDPQVALHRAIMVGLTRYPEVLAQHVETVAALPFGGDLATLRDQLVDAAVFGWPLPTPPFVATLPFSFVRSIDPAGAADLIETIRLLVAEAATAQAERDAIATAKAGDDDAFAQLRAVAADRAALAERLVSE